MASSIENYPLYPYPSEFSVTDFVPDKLSDSNYKEWKKLMLDFIESRGLVGFIDGTVEAPPSAPPENEEQYRSWKRSDGLVRGWILTTLTKDILMRVLPFKTAKEVWTTLETTFRLPTQIQIITLVDVRVEWMTGEETEEFLLACQPLQIAAIKGDWESAMKFIEELRVAARVPITRYSETALMIAVRIIRRNHFVKKLLQKMEPEDLANRDVEGQTALLIAAGVGNIEATKLLVEKNPTLSNVDDFDGEIALQCAARHGNREVVLYLLDATKQDQQLQPFEDKLGAELLCDLSSSGLYDIALTLLQRYPNLACIEEFSPLKIIAAKRSSFRNVPVELENIAKPHSGGDIKNPIDCLIYGWNNALHLAALLGPQQQLSLSVSAALQMQRELQWFKEVEKLVLPGDKEERNTNGMTPAKVFTDTHQELVKEGERWMKGTATSCTIVAALIVTVVFAAAITVPGGNNNNDGHPYFSKHKAFLIFGIFDALALFSSITSVLMFLSILTARYAEEDFLYALPKRLIIGLVMLFVSLLSMMIAFGATLYLMFGDNKVWILVPVVAALQFPLLVVMIKSISSSATFGKRSDRMLL
ncbi:unnamed protein product [Camellia sinensis]